LKDPLGDRNVKDLVLPPVGGIKDEGLFNTTTGVPNWQLVQKFLATEGMLTKPQLIKICRMAMDLFKKEPNLTKILEPVVIVGDVHGQYYDVEHMLEKAGKPSDVNYLFLGDYVDRGIYGTEVMILLMCLKLNFPTSIILLRGNHESRSMTENFTFRKEVIDRYDENMYEIFLEVFNSLPLACLVDDKYLAMHGGISPEL
jgi:serine/threonine-protein phosphatase 2B catalytic subunit